MSHKCETNVTQCVTIIGLTIYQNRVTNVYRSGSGQLHGAVTDSKVAGNLSFCVHLENACMARAEPSLKGEAEKRFFEIWFSNETEPNSELGKEVKQQLVALASKPLFEKVRAKAKEQETKSKAEILLKGLKEWLLPK